MQGSLKERRYANLFRGLLRRDGQCHQAHNHAIPVPRGVDEAATSALYDHYTYNPSHLPFIAFDHGPYCQMIVSHLMSGHCLVLHGI